MKNAIQQTLMVSLLLILLPAGTVNAAVPNFSNYPLSSSGQAGVQPNVMLSLDDSGSMSWDYLPDWAHTFTDHTTNLEYDSATGQTLFRNPAYNGLAYNPAIRYLPPYYLNDDGTVNSTTYPSMTGLSAATGADMTKSTPNWKAVKADGYGVQALADATYVIGTGQGNTCPDTTANRSTCNLESLDASSLPYAYSYKFTAGEYCTDKHMTSCVPLLGPSTTYPVASVLRWCTTQASQTVCQALYDDTGTLPGTPAPNYIYPRVAGIATGSGYRATITVSTCTNPCSLTSVTINGTSYPVSGATGTTKNLLASSIYAALPSAIPSAAVSNLSTNTFRLILPVSSAPTVSFTASSGSTITVGSWSATTGVVTGTNTRTNIISTTTSYAKSSERTDCVESDHCTYVEEMTNYANWLAYYRTRLQMMKTATSNSFSVLDDHYRVGYFTISTSRFLNPDGFVKAVKKSWYDKLFATDAPLSNSTPLRGSVSRLGQFYAGTHNGETWGGVTVTDPMQYSCQQNFEILATDGYWNIANDTSTYGPLQLDNHTSVGEQDGGPGTGAGQELRPQYDGQFNSYSKTTTQVTQTDKQTSQQDSWFETTEAGSQQKIWDLLVTVTTWGYVETTTSYDKTTYTLTGSSTTYAYVLDGVSFTGQSSCPTGATCTSTTTYTYTSGSTVAVPSCTASGSKTNGDATVIKCSSANVTTRDITSGVCTPTTTATAKITCSSLQGVQTNKLATCPATAVGTATSAGQQTCGTPKYQLRNNSPYWVAACAVSPIYSGSGTPPYQSGATGPSKFSQSTVYGTCTNGVSTTTVTKSCTASAGPPAISCSAQITDPPFFTTAPKLVKTSTCNPGDVTISSYKNASNVTVASGTATETCTNTTVNNSVPVASCSCSPLLSCYNSTTHYNTTCQASTSTLNNQSVCVDATADSTNNYTSTACTGTFSGGSTDSLADVAEYYYRTDLRPTGGSHCTGATVNSTSNDVCLDNVKTNSTDTNSKQHMTTYTLGLGVSGQMLYSQSYPEDLSGDYWNVWQGSARSASTCPWQATGSVCNWSTPVESTLTTIDDLWHAAVDGRGKYFSAGNASELSKSISGALSGIAVRVGAGSAAATSNLQPVQGDNFAYVASFETQTWVGDLQARTIDLTTGAVSSGLDSNGKSTCGVTDSGCLWSAQVVLDAQNGITGGKTASSTAPSSIATASTRSIFLEPDTGTTWRSFNYASLTSTEKNYFTTAINLDTNLQGLVTGTNPVATVASNVVDFLAGDRSLEGNGLRSRDHILGDIVSSTPVYVGKSPYNYTDTGYGPITASGTFANAQKTRNGVVYVMANDGMLHAFDAVTGHENWAFVPKSLLSEMYKLAKTGYAHQYYLDGEVTIGDAYFTASGASSPSWHTVLVGGFGKGGSGYFALDITDPTVPPVFLWSVSAATSGFENLGYSFGNAAINKLPGGQWVAMFSSGYNNADGQGYLYAVNIASGAMMSGFPLATTATASATDPSNLGEISPWVDIPDTDNTAYFVYSGDFAGNIWRFDLGTLTTTSATVPKCTGVGSIHNCTTGQPVFKLANLTAPDGTSQPVTTRIEITTLDSRYRLIFVGTGSYLTTTDPSVTQVQTLYAIKDPLDDLSSNPSAQASFNAPRTITSTPATSPATYMFLPRYLVSDTQKVGSGTGTPIRVMCKTSDCSAGGTEMDWAGLNGWYVDFPESGERVNVQMNLTLGTLVVPSNIPAVSSCESGGHGWVNYMDFESGLSIPSTVIGATTEQPVASRPISNALIVGVNMVQLPDNTLAAIVSTSDYQNQTVLPAFAPASFSSRLDFWRDLEAY